MDFITCKDGLIIFELNGTTRHFVEGQDEQARLSCKAQGVRSVMCSSSVDFSEEYGFAGGRDFVQAALSWQGEDLMDAITIDLLSAIDLLLRHGGNGQRWYFERDSEIHIALVEANTQARIALGIDRPEIPNTEHVTV